MGSTIQSSQQPLTRDDVEALAHRLHRIRDAWHVGSLVTLLTRLADLYDGPVLRKAAIGAAGDPHIKTPAGIEWTVADHADRANRAASNEPCAVCGKARDTCTFDRPLVRTPEDVDDHVYLTAAEVREQAATKRSAQ